MLGLPSVDHEADMNVTTIFVFVSVFSTGKVYGNTEEEEESRRESSCGQLDTYAGS